MPSSTVQWVIQPITVSGLSLAVARLEVDLYLAASSTGQPSLQQRAWVDTGAPLSVVPFYIQQSGLLWQPIPGIQVTWSGQRCDLGRIDVWLATDLPPHFHGPFSLLAKFPRGDPPGPDLPILLGLEFFLSHQAELHLLPLPQQGVISLP